jgi:hypothetical protein
MRRGTLSLAEGLALIAAFGLTILFTIIRVQS